ncbi:MAG: pimeloyl-ACP methyl ester carboxylesterase [Gammaproteobacteria bacterium]|jgi:pimeloyl-ACP methyl ester carboxylesterase
MIREYELVLPSTTIQYLSANIEEITVKPVLLFFHGFPECSFAWEKYLHGMSTEYCVIAPDLPGYRFSNGFKSTDEYNIENLITSMAAFVSQLLIDSSQRKVHLVAHDWGGAIAWPLAAFHESLLHSLTIINAAHPSAFTREMRDNPVQQEKSEYIAGFMQSDAGIKMQKNDFCMFKKLFGHQFFTAENENACVVAANSNDKASKSHQKESSLFSSRQLTEYISQWNDAKSLDNMLNYYRKMPQIKTKGYVSQQGPLKIPNIRINLPTLVLWGEDDSAFVIDNLIGLDEWVLNLQIHKIPGATHWVHHQQPEYIMAMLSKFLINLTNDSDYSN